MFTNLCNPCAATFAFVFFGTTLWKTATVFAEIEGNAESSPAALSGQALSGPGPALQLPDPQILQQGPIHEAFAEPLALERQATEVIPQQPPEPVKELPPDEQPEGRNVDWIPGYWKWDLQLKDFLWVSGLWRDFPPGRQWVPGEWAEVPGGFLWTHGFWSDAGEQQLRFLPNPPASLEQGPSSPAPGDSFLWAPGCWQFRGDGFSWQAGYWYQAQPNWVWVPSHYSYSPQGCVYVGGYWDYPLAYRGLLYAPVYWGAGYRGRYGSTNYRPCNVINTGLLIANLFVDRHYGHYHFGYDRHGKVPHWLHAWGHGYNRWGGVYHKRKHHHDPLWAHHRQGQRHHEKKHHDGLGRSYDSSEFARARRKTSIGGKALVTPLAQLDPKQSDTLKLRRLSENERSVQQNRAEKYRHMNRQQLLVSDEFRKQANTKIRQDVQAGRAKTHDTVRQFRPNETRLNGSASERRPKSGQANARISSSLSGQAHAPSDKRIQVDQRVRQETQPGLTVGRSQQKVQSRTRVETSSNHSLPSNFIGRKHGAVVTRPQRSMTKAGTHSGASRENRALKVPTAQLRSISPRNFSARNLRSGQTSSGSRSYASRSLQSAAPAQRMQRSIQKRSGSGAFQGHSGNEHRLENSKGGGGQRSRGRR